MSDNFRTRCLYLQEENENLKQQVLDGQLVLKLNKDAMRMCEGDKNQNRAATIILQHVQQENAILLQQLSVSRKERDLAYDKALISEQINEAFENQEKKTIEELQDQNKILQNQLNDRDQIIAKYKNSQKQEALIYLEKEIVNPSEVALLQNHRMQMQNLVLMKYYNQIHELMEQKDDIVQLNITLSNEILKLRTQRQTPRVTHGGSFNFCINKFLIIENLKEDPNKYIINLVRLQQKILGDDSMDEKEIIGDVFSPIFSPMALKVIPVTKKQMKKHESKQQHLTECLDNQIPKLNLLKAQQIQSYNLSRIQQLMAQKNRKNSDNTNLEEQIQKLTADLSKIRNKYSSLIVINQFMELNLTQIKIQLQDALSNNTTLINSNKMFEKKWSKISNAYQLFKSFYNENQVQSKLQESGKSRTTNSQQIRDESNIKTAGFVSTLTNRQNVITLMEYQDELPSLEEIKDDEEDSKQGVDFKQSYHNMLMDLAQDVYRIDFDANQQNIVKKNQKLFRSYSNTLDYVMPQ